MFGLNDNATNTNGDTTQPSASDTSTLPPLTTSVPEEIPTASPVSAGPVSTSSNEGANVAASTSPAMPLNNSPTNVASAAGISDVNLENAYIANDPPQISSQTGYNSASKPTAASLINNDAQGNEDELLKLKQQALQSLAPLVDHLEQSSEEKFKTTMMLIQASDNSDLIPEAYEAANKIEDEKARAQALLDVVNEINYFTQQHNK
jgi:hypothetical protein